MGVDSHAHLQPIISNFSAVKHNITVQINTGFISKNESFPCQIKQKAMVVVFYNYYYI